ncbi:transporter substrate-binding domain-containing protein [Succinimonas sp.]|uniref:transporter substrate-binding domain-containing diguanylate cyclase n=1 Tax=Succinimonas sp. TaxID=1936151 RepID=UPI00386FC5B1
MKTAAGFQQRILRTAAFLLIALLANMPLSLSVHADDGAGANQSKVVRVGWYDSAYCYTDQFGRRRGIAYEYQQRIAAHTGWVYEYVEGSWPNLFQMLMNGEIDLLSDVSYVKEREEHMLFSNLPMGTESYYSFVIPENDSVSPEDLSTYNGKHVGVNKNSIQSGMLRDWAARNGLDIDIEYITNTGDEAVDRLKQGDLDALVALDGYGARYQIEPVSKIGSSDFFFAVNKKRPDILNELNKAMFAIHDEDPLYNHRLTEEYLLLTKTNAYVSPDLEAWLAKHDTITIGYVDNFLPFCARDKKTGELTGALKDYLEAASTRLKNASINFEPLPFASTEDALAALKRGEVDSIFPINISSDDGEKHGMFPIAPLINTEMTLLVRPDTPVIGMPNMNLTVAINAGNTSYENFIKDNAPNWNIKTCSPVEECFRAVKKGEADSLIIPSYRLNQFEEMTDNYGLVHMHTGETMGMSFAVRRDAPELYAVLSKLVHLVSADDMQYAVASYAYHNHKVSVMEVLKNHWIAVIILIVSIFSVIQFLLIKKLRAERKINEQQQKLISVTRIAYRDPLTGVKSKNAYNEACQEIDNRIASKEVSAFAAVLFDLNNLKIVNDTQGHNAGDTYIKKATHIICQTFSHSPVFRIGGDEFVAILERLDFEHREELFTAFANQMNHRAESGDNTIAFGYSCFDPKTDKSIKAVVERADSNMYKNKKLLKSKMKK